MKIIFGIICLGFLSFANLLEAQTKWIAFKSHSGNPANFNTALANNLFDMPFSNFGMAPQRIVSNAELDTVIFVNDTTTIVVTSKHCVDLYSPSDNTIWRMGKDTVVNHPLFSRKISVDSMKSILKNQYFFKNSIDSVCFIDFKNKLNFNDSLRNEKLKKQTLPPFNHNNSFPTHKLFWILLVGLLAVLISYINLKWTNRKGLKI